MTRDFKTIAQSIKVLYNVTWHVCLLIFLSIPSMFPTTFTAAYIILSLQCKISNVSHVLSFICSCLGLKCPLQTHLHLLRLYSNSSLSKFLHPGIATGPYYLITIVLSFLIFLKKSENTQSVLDLSQYPCISGPHH